MNIDYLSPELQEEFRRVFSDDIAREIDSTENQSLEEETRLPEIEDTEFEIIEESRENTPGISGDTFILTVNENQFNNLENTIDQEINIPEVEDLTELLTERSETEENIVDDTVVGNSIVSSNELDEIIQDLKKRDELKSQYTRFRGADWFDIVKQQHVILAGLGGIGSYINFFLSRLNPEVLYLYDGDTFESHNMSGQLVDTFGISKSKVEVAENIAQRFSDYQVYAYNNPYTEGSLTTPIMICGFDNMGARKIFYNNWKKAIDPLHPNTHLFIDGRLLAEEFQIICITGEDEYSQKLYEEEYLFDDDMVEEVSCTLKQTSHIAGMIGSQMVTYFVNFCNNLSENNFPRRLPFFTHYNSIVNTYEFKY